jgi:hypothetical protein
MLCMLGVGASTPWEESNNGTRLLEWFAWSGAKIKIEYVHSHDRCVYAVLYCQIFLLWLLTMTLSCEHCRDGYYGEIIRGYAILIGSLLIWSSYLQTHIPRICHVHLYYCPLIFLEKSIMLVINVHSCATHTLPWTGHIFMHLCLDFSPDCAGSDPFIWREMQSVVTSTVIHVYHSISVVLGFEVTCLVDMVMPPNGVSDPPSVELVAIATTPVADMQ